MSIYDANTQSPQGNFQFGVKNYNWEAPFHGKRKYSQVDHDSSCSSNSSHGNWSGDYHHNRSFLVPNTPSQSRYFYEKRKGGFFKKKGNTPPMKKQRNSREDLDADLDNIAESIQTKKSNSPQTEEKSEARFKHNRSDQTKEDQVGSSDVKSLDDYMKMSSEELDREFNFFLVGFNLISSSKWTTLKNFNRHFQTLSKKFLFHFECVYNIDHHYVG